MTMDSIHVITNHNSHIVSNSLGVQRDGTRGRCLAFAAVNKYGLQGVLPPDMVRVIGKLVFAADITPKRIWQVILLDKIDPNHTTTRLQFEVLTRKLNGAVYAVNPNGASPYHDMTFRHDTIDTCMKKQDEWYDNTSSIRSETCPRCIVITFENVCNCSDPTIVDGSTIQIYRITIYHYLIITRPDRRVCTMRVILMDHDFGAQSLLRDEYFIDEIGESRTFNTAYRTIIHRTSN